MYVLFNSHAHRSNFSPSGNGCECFARAKKAEKNGFHNESFKTIAFLEKHMSRTRLVKEVYNPEKMNSLIFTDDQTIEKIIKTFAEEVHLRGIFIVNKEGQFMGVITRNDLLIWAKYKLGSVTYRYTRGPSYNEIKRYVLSSKISEMIHPNSAEFFVKEDDDILKALNLMLYSNLIDVPVLNKDRKIMGDLKLSEILLKIINAPISRAEEFQRHIAPT